MKKLLAASRLVTLTGVGGAGKTRLALRAAAATSGDYPDGTWFVDLGAVDDPALLAQSIASSLGLQDRRAGSPLAALADYVSDKKLLLCLDNCDHLRDESAVLADALLRQAPDLHMLITSRQTLGVTGEHVFRVPPLSVPDDDAQVRADSVAHYEALNLFAERAQAVSSGFEITESNVQAAAAICHRLDGIPLAIELAAARLSAMSVHDLLDRLEDRYHVLVGRGPSALPRHRTLRELINWSWDLCTEEEQTLWARTSVFPASFDLSAVEAICADPPLEPRAMLEVVTALVDKSIVSVIEESGRVRYRLLETLRQFGQEQLLARGEASQVRETHRNHFAKLARDASSDWFSERQSSWLARLRLEQSNIRASLEASFESAELSGAGLDLASDLWFFWITTGQTNEARRWFERGLSASPSVSTPRTRAMVICAYLCVQQEDLSTAAPLIDAALRTPAASENGSIRAWATQVDGMAAMCEGDLARAKAVLEDALVSHRANREPGGVVDTIFFLAAVNALEGDVDRAEALYREAIITCEGHGETWAKGYMLWGLALVAWQRGEIDRAASHARQALRVGRQLDDYWAIAFCIEFLAWSAEVSGNHRQAGLLLGGAAELWRRVGWHGLGVPLYYGMRELNTYHDRCISRLTSLMGVGEMELVLAQGATTPLNDLIADALGEAVPSDVERSRTRGPDLPALTKREKEVADLVTDGLSNKEIANRLFISQRTAEVHVENILTKFGFKSRAQIAAWVAEQRSRARNDS